MTAPPPAATPEGHVGLSTSSVYPESTATAFAMAVALGFDAVEVMVGTDETSQSIAAVSRLRERYDIPVAAVHAPCLLLTQRVWGTDPWGKLKTSTTMADALGAAVVVVHPPFRWQRDYARTFVDGVAALEDRTGVPIAVENMYPWRASRRELLVYAPHWDAAGQGYRHTTLDVSHAATAGVDALDLARRLGPSLRHVHVTDGSGGPMDEHLVPGRGAQPVAALMEHLAATGFGGHLVVEVSTRRAGSAARRESDLAESLAFVRLHFSAPAAAPSPGGTP